MPFPESCLFASKSQSLCIFLWFRKLTQLDTKRGHWTGVLSLNSSSPLDTPAKLQKLFSGFYYFHTTFISASNNLNIRKQKVLSTPQIMCLELSLWLDRNNWSYSHVILLTSTHLWSRTEGFLVDLIFLCRALEYIFPQSVKGQKSHQHYFLSVLAWSLCWTSALPRLGADLQQTPKWLAEEQEWHVLNITVC